MSEDGEDEDLEQPRRVARRGSGRAGPALMCLAVLAAAAGAIVHVAHHDALPRADASVTMPPPPSQAPPSQAPPSQAPASQAPAATTPGGASGCPPGVSCLRITSVPGDVRDAIRAVFPRMTVRSSLTVLGDTDGAGSHLLFRRVALRVGASDIVVVVGSPDAGSPPRSSTGAGAAGGEGTRVAVVRFPELTVTVTATSRHLPPLGQLRALARDERVRAALV